MHHAVLDPPEYLVAVRAQDAASLAGLVIVVQMQAANAGTNRPLVLATDCAGAELAVQDGQVFVVCHAKFAISVRALRLSLAGTAPVSSRGEVCRGNAALRASLRLHIGLTVKTHTLA